MCNDGAIDGRPRIPASDEQERIRKLNAAELQAICDRVGAEAQARGLTEEILNGILNEKSTAKEAALRQDTLQEMRAIVAENLKLAKQRGLTEVDVPSLISETRQRTLGDK
jgi:hypothetical protein